LPIFWASFLFELAASAMFATAQIQTIETNQVKTVGRVKREASFDVN